MTDDAMGPGRKRRAVADKPFRDWLAELAAVGALVPASALLERLAAAEPSTVEDGDLLVDMTVERVAEILNRSPSTVRQWCRDGLLPGSYLLRGKRWAVPRSAIAAFQAAEAARGMSRIKDQPDAPVLPSSGPVDLGAWRRVREGGA